MSRVLGVLPKGGELLLAVADDGRILSDGCERLQAPALLEATERLQSMLSDLRRLLAELKPDLVRILMAEQTYSDTYARIAPKAALETLMRLAAASEGVPVEMLHRNSARSRLGMPKGGKFEANLPTALATPVGKYWNAGRRLAAAAALAGQDR